MTELFPTLERPAKAIWDFASGLIFLGVMIVDARHKPTADDVTMANWFFDAGCPVVVVANKLDKLKKSEVEPNTDLPRFIREGAAGANPLPLLLHDQVVSVLRILQAVQRLPGKLLDIVM